MGYFLKLNLNNFFAAIYYQLNNYGFVKLFVRPNVEAPIMVSWILSATYE